MDEQQKRLIIRDAATVILLRTDTPEPSVLMGQRGAGAAFMPSKYVFPGGAVDAFDANVPFARSLPEVQADKLSVQASLSPNALAIAAVRELWEETGLKLAASFTGDFEGHPDWNGFFTDGQGPDASALKFIFRAITPTGRPRRFDARFFLADATAVSGDLDDFTHACDELSHLHWIALSEAKALDLPFITEVVLSEVQATLRTPQVERKVPFFQHDAERSYFNMI